MECTIIIIIIIVIMRENNSPHASYYNKFPNMLFFFKKCLPDKITILCSLTGSFLSYTPTCIPSASLVHSVPNS